MINQQTTMEDKVQLIMQKIRELKRERERTPRYEFQAIESMTQDINYYAKQLDAMS